jgi:hypothetical protein
VRDVVGSPFSIQDYSPDPRIATAEGLTEVHKQLRRRGMGLILDFVPNHTGFDHGWMVQHPDRYIQGREQDFRGDPAAFYLVEREGDENLFVARGRDPYFPPWSDVAQLNYFNPDCRQGMIGILKNIAQYCDRVRCDMAMLVTNEIFNRTWGHLLRSWPVPTTDFWSEATAAAPDFLWLAEVYWDLEWRMQELGFQFAYDKRLYDRLMEASIGPGAGPSGCRHRLPEQTGTLSREPRRATLRGSFTARKDCCCGHPAGDAARDALLPSWPTGREEIVRAYAPGQGATGNRRSADSGIVRAVAAFH